jgi:hypothetical protein
MAAQWQWVVVMIVVVLVEMHVRLLVEMHVCKVVHVQEVFVELVLVGVKAMTKAVQFQ